MYVNQNRQKWRNFQAHLAKIVQYASFMQNSDFMHFLPKRQKYAKTYAICNCIDLLALVITIDEKIVSLAYIASILPGDAQFILHGRNYL